MFTGSRYILAVGVFLRLLARLALWIGLLAAAGPAMAASCGSATSGGTASAGWETYCWLDFSTYNDVVARTVLGQNFTFALSDGSTFNVNVRATSTAATAVNSVVAPSWTGAAVGNTAFLGIPGKPILYTANNASTVTLTLSNMSITPPAGSPAVTRFMLVAADAESTNTGETLSFVTNGSNWTTLNTVPPISGSSYPTLTNSGTTVTETGADGSMGGFIFGTSTPTTVTATLGAGGLQGAMFAVRFASLRLNKVIVNSRNNAADQFTYTVSSTTNGTVFATKTTSGTGLSGFSDAVAIMASGLPVTLTETMAAGSSSTLATYTSRLTCTNATTGSTTVLPTNVAATSYNFGSLAYGDAVSCAFTNTPYPQLAMTKVSAVVSDPLNGTTNPKMIPGAVVRYTITVTNNGGGPVDMSTVVITDPLPTSIVPSVAGTPVTFTDGPTPSGLSFAASNVSWSRASGGGTPYTYTPVPDANGYDAAVTGIRFAPTGVFAGKSGTTAPSFSLSFLARIN